MSLFCYLLFHFHSENLLLTVYLFPSDQVRINKAVGYLYYIIAVYSQDYMAGTTSFSSPIGISFPPLTFADIQRGFTPPQKLPFYLVYCKDSIMYAKQPTVGTTKYHHQKITTHLIFFRRIPRIIRVLFWDKQVISVQSIKVVSSHLN